MLFDEDWVKVTNDSKDTKEASLSVTYLNGFKGTDAFNRNRMTDWKVRSAKNDVMEVELTFEDPLWVSQNTLPCFVKLDFRDGQRFKSAGFDKHLAKDTVRRVQLEK